MEKTIKDGGSRKQEIKHIQSIQSLNSENVASNIHVTQIQMY